MDNREKLREELGYKDNRTWRLPVRAIIETLEDKVLNQCVCHNLTEAEDKIKELEDKINHYEVIKLYNKAGEGG